MVGWKVACVSREYVTPAIFPLAFGENSDFFFTLMWRLGILSSLESSDELELEELELELESES